MIEIQKGDIVLCSGLEQGSPSKILARVESTHFDGFFKATAILNNKLDSDLTVLNYDTIIKNFGKINYKTFKTDYPEYIL